MGEVYEAEDLVLHGEHIALKTLPALMAGDERAVLRLKREIEVARRVTHPNVCRVFDADQHPTAAGPITFFTMELLRGDTLAERLRQRGRMPIADAQPLLRQMAAGLGAAHAAGIVHGDFKPGNVMLVPGQDGSPRVVATDFGLARQASTGPESLSMATSHAGWGTPAYMAPEQVEHWSVTPAADIYALGIVAYEMVTGRLPFEANTPLEVAVQKLRRPSDPLQQTDGANARWQAAIHRCLERDPDARFKTADDFVDALDAPAVIPPRPWPWLVGIAGLGVVAALVSPPVRAVLTRAPVMVAIVPDDRIVALLPFADPNPAPESQAYSRGLAAALTDELRLASELEHVEPRVLVIPADEVLDADFKTAQEAQRALGASLVLTGRLERDGRATTITVDPDAVTVRGTTRGPSRTVKTPAGESVLGPRALSQFANIVGLSVGSRTLEATQAGGSQVPAAEEPYLQGRGFLAGAGINLDKAMEGFERAIQLDRRYALAHATLGDAYLQKYRATLDASLVARAQTHADEAIALGPSVAYTHVVRGRVYQASGQNERAIRELESALQIDPGIVDARGRLAEMYEGEGSFQKAEDVYRQEIGAFQHYWAPYVSYGSFLIKHGRYREAETNLVNGLRYAPDNTRAIGVLAGLYIFTERLVAAEAELRRGLSIKPEVVVCNNLAWIQIYQGKFPEAVQWMEQAVRLPDADSFHWGNLARAYRWSGQRPQAQTTYEKAIGMARQEISHNPRDARIRANYAQMLAETGRRSESLVEIAATLERAPKDLSVMFRSALVRELTGDRPAALQALETAVRGGYSGIDIRRHPDLARLREDPQYVRIMTMAPIQALQ